MFTDKVYGATRKSVATKGCLTGKVMHMVGRVEKYLLEKIKADGSIHMTLVDPEKVTPEQASQIAENAKASGTAAIMIGALHFCFSESSGRRFESHPSAVKTPTILFPNNITGISRHADAIWFMSLLNSVDPYFLVGAQISRRTTVKKFGFRTHFYGLT